MARSVVLGFFCCPSAVCRSVSVAGKRSAKLLGDAVIRRASRVFPFGYCRAGRVNHFALPSLLVSVALIKIGYFSVGLLQLTFLRSGETSKTDAREGENPQKSGSFLSLGRLRVWSRDAIRFMSFCTERGVI